MPKNTPISLGDHSLGFVDQQVAQKRYGSASKVVRAEVRLLEELEARLAAVRQALVTGEESSPSTPFDFDAFVAGKRTPKGT